jgi:hypothetical protein
VSPKKKVLLLSGIFAIFGVSVSVVIIAVGGGFSEPGPSLLNPPTASNLWMVGQTLHLGTIMNYSLTRVGSHSSPWSSLGGQSSLISSLVSMRFTMDKYPNNDSWKVLIGIANGTTTPMIYSKQDTVSLSKQHLTNVGPINADFLPYYEPIESSILEIRDIALAPEYLVVGARWNTITVGVTTIPVGIITQEKLHTSAGAFDAYVLGYTIGSKLSRIWIAHDIPLPIKAEVYNSQGELQYKYELIAKKL